MKRSLVANALNVLIVVTLVASIGVLGAILLTAVQSAPSLSIGSVTSTTSGTVTQIQAPISVSNRGYFSFSNINVQVTVKDSSNDQLLMGTVGPVTIAPGETRQINANLSLDTSKLSAPVVQKLATTSQNLTVTATVGGSIPPFIAITGAVSAQLPWGAPVSNLAVGVPSFAPLNGTAVTVTVPVSFQNMNNYLTISGTGSISVLDSTGKKVGGGAVQVNAPPNDKIMQSVNLVVGIPTSQIQSLLFNDQNLSYSAVLTFQSGGQTVFTLTQPISYAWKAPLSGLTVGSPSVATLNSTNFQVTIPVSFTNANEAFDLSTSVSAAIFNATSGAQIGSGSLNLVAPHGSSFSGSLVGSVRFPSSAISTLAFNDRTLNLRATLSGTYSGVPFSFDRSVSLNWGAPLKNLAFGSFTQSLYNTTSAQFSVSISFLENSAFPVTGTVSGEVLDTSNNQVGSITALMISAQPGQSYTGTLTGFLKLASVTGNTFVFNLTINTSFGTVTKVVTISA